MSWNFYRKILNVLLQNLMRMEHFEIYILKLIKFYILFWSDVIYSIKLN